MNDELNAFECAVLTGLAATEFAVVLLAIGLFVTACEPDPAQHKSSHINLQLHIP